MSIWEKMGFGGYKGFSHEADRLRFVNNKMRCALLIYIVGKSLG